MTEDPSTKQFIDEKLVINRVKFIAFCTKHIFTAGHTSSQRSESLDSFFLRFWFFFKEENGSLEYIPISDMVRSMCSAYLYGNAY